LGSESQDQDWHETEEFDNEEKYNKKMDITDGERRYLFCQCWARSG